MLNLYSQLRRSANLVRIVRCLRTLPPNLLLATVIALLSIASTGELLAQDSTRSRDLRIGTDSRSRSSLARQRQIARQSDMVFIENRGQWDSTVRFRLRGNGIDTWILENGVVYDFHNVEATKERGARGSERERLESFGLRPNQLPPIMRRKGQVIQLAFENAAAPKSIHGTGQATQRYNYFLGSDSTRWASQVSAYDRVISRGIYPGIDMVHYVDQGSPRYDIIVHPGADPSDIRMRIDGAERVRVNNKGELVMASSIGDLYQGEPFAYQERNGKRIQVECAFQRTRDGEVSFRVGSYDETRPLVIDPVIYSTYLGGNDYDVAHGITVDPEGNAYIVGYTQSGDFPTTTGAYDSLEGGDWDAVVSKLSADGSTLIFSTFFGGSGMDLGVALALDDSLNVVFAGNTASYDLPISTLDGHRYTNPSSNHDVFVAKLSSNGSALTHGTYLGGSQTDWCNGLVLDANSNACVVGMTLSDTVQGFPTKAGAYDRVHNGGRDIYVTMYNPSLKELVFSTFIGGPQDDYADGVAIDTSGNLYITGASESALFPWKTGAYDSVHNGSADIIVVKLKAIGDSLLYSTFIGDTAYDRAYAIAVDADNAAYVTGFTASGNYPVTSGVVGSTYAGNHDVIVTKLNAAGSALIYSTFLGGSSGDTAYTIVVDTLGQAYVGGTTLSSNFPVVPGSFDETYNGGITGDSLKDGFVTKINPMGSSLGYSTYLGGSFFDYVDCLALVQENLVYATGGTRSLNFPKTPNRLRDSLAGSTDIFITLLYTVPATGTTTITGGIINDYFPVVSITGCADCVFTPYAGTGVPGGVQVGDRLMIMQMAGALFQSTNDRTYGSIEHYGSAGLYEFATVATLDTTVIEGDTVLCLHFAQPLAHYYTPSVSSPVQLIRLPQYDNVVISGATVTALPWDPETGTGGVVALEASGQITIRSNIDVSGKGFQGGDASALYIGGARKRFDYLIAGDAEYAGRKGRGIGAVVEDLLPGTESRYARGSAINGGGGGNLRGAGGGGGSNFGAGGGGGRQATGPPDDDCVPANIGGVGGRPLQYNATEPFRVFMGGGGGGGHQTDDGGADTVPQYAGAGGAGGGIVIISATSVVGQKVGSQTPRIKAQGGDGSHSSFAGAGGGGAGGAIYITTPPGGISGDLVLDVTGGSGGNADGSGLYCYGPGGGGGGGHVRLSSALLPSGLTNHVVGGSAGGVLSGGIGYACRGQLVPYGAVSGSTGVYQLGPFVLPGDPLAFNGSSIEMPLWRVGLLSRAQDIVNCPVVPSSRIGASVMIALGR